MELAGRHTFEAARAIVWEALLDPEVLAKTVPGCERLEEVGEREYAGAMRLAIGPVEGRFEGTVKLSDLDPPNGYAISIRGNGAQGFVNGSGTVRLDGDGPTELAYELKADVGGRLASVGQRLLDRSAQVITRQALEGLEKQIAARAEAAATGAPARQVAAPTQGQFAARFAKEMAAETVPPRARPWMALAATALAALVLILALRACGG
jgi:carbon monoxide dehydrogenase subunit G